MVRRPTPPPSWSSATSAKSEFVASALLETKSRKQNRWRARPHPDAWPAFLAPRWLSFRNLCTGARSISAANDGRAALSEPWPRARGSVPTRKLAAAAPGCVTPCLASGGELGKAAPPGLVCDPAPGCSRSHHLSICALKSSVYAPICPPAGDLVAGRGPLSLFSGFPGPQENRSLPPPATVTITVSLVEATQPTIPGPIWQQANRSLTGGGGRGAGAFISPMLAARAALKDRLRCGCQREPTRALHKALAPATWAQLLPGNGEARACRRRSR